MNTNTPRDLLFDQLRDLHSAETQILSSLPGLAARAAYPPLCALITEHAGQTRRQLETLASIFQRHGMEPGNDKCKAMEGLIAGGDAHLDQVEVPQTRDLMMVAHCSRIEHYEIAGYGIAVRLAQRLGLQEEAAILESILGEELAAASGLEALEPALHLLAKGKGLN
ncbi:MAG: ferritin-like domain-containing protein [Verrucomicrobiaceae bacterium]|nr:MAG: ferritin-like domain-containing protein [Verrucomicrobiaceae bacterium]